ncbi:GNAT family N-acetyltransferase [Saccharopolyspora halophila]|uniref:GNAT family N-acetyltransferase n=1 Tax=Saccharopolyspora halophila TaxID=405551 RepID=A0ABP5T9V3_9PSEU
MTEQNFTIDSEPYESSEAQNVLAEYVAELEQRFPGGFDTARAAPPAKDAFIPPNGVFLLVRAGGRALGCGAVRRRESGIAEIRRMWISPALRGRGVGKALLAALEEHARELGCTEVRLDTASELTEARALYAKAGYREVPAYNDNSYAAHWFAKTLG